MAEYDLQPALKTKVLNVIRKIFTFKIIDRIIASIYVKYQLAFVEKLIPLPYLYSAGSWRKVERQGLYYDLDISEMVDHFVYFGYKEKCFDYVKDNLKDAKVILDIGANIGWSAMNFSKFAPDAVVYSFEPHPITYRKALNNLLLNNLTNINIYNIGLGDRNSVEKLYEVSAHNSGMNRIVNKDLPMSYKEVTIERMDDFLSKLNIDKIDFIKIDVEGFENSVIRGGLNFFKKCSPILMIEVDDAYLRFNDSSANELLETLIYCGYNNFFRLDKETELIINDNLSNCHFDLICRKN